MPCKDNYEERLEMLAQLASKIDSKAYLSDGSFTYAVIIKDIKQSYGVTRYLVTPADGSGTHWVNADRVKESK